MIHRRFSRFARALSASIALAVIITGPAAAGPDDQCGVGLNERCTLWESTYAGTGGGPDGASAIVLDPVGGPSYVGGHTTGAGTGSDFLTVAYGFGSTYWSGTYDGPGSGNDRVAAMTLDQIGYRLFVTGPSVGADGSSDFATIAYAALPDGESESGDQIWVSRYSGGGADDAVDVALSADEYRLYVTGTSQNADGTTDAMTIAYDVITGATLWEQRFNGAANGSDAATALAVAPTATGDRVLVAVRSNGAAGEATSGIEVIAYDGETGAQSWTHSYDGPGADQPTDIVVAGNGAKAFVAGASVDAASGSDYVTVAINATTGTRAWASRYDGGNGDDAASAIAVTPNGASVFVTGTSKEQLDALQRAAATVAYDTASGSQKWVTRFADPAGNAGTDVFSSPDGEHVYVTGLGAGQQVGDRNVVSMITLGYRADSGAVEWLARYRQDGGAAAGAVSPDGTMVVVTGGMTDAITIGYDSGVPAPAVPMPTSIVPPPYINAANRTAVTVTGNARVGDNVIVALSDGANTVSGQSYVSDGTYSVTLNASSLTDGPVEARARAYRIPYGYSEFLRTTVLKDTQVAAPTVRIARDPVSASSAPETPIQGNTEPGATIALELTDGVDDVSATATASTAGAFSASMDASSLADGTLTVSAVATDPAGNTSSAGTGTARKDSLAPAAPVVLTPTSGSTSSASKVAIAGTAEPGATVALSEGTTSLGSVTADGSGSWTVDRTFTNGAHTLSATARDAAGNVSPAASRSFSVAAPVPSAPTIVSPATGSEQLKTFTVSGTGQPGTTVVVQEGTRTAGSKFVPSSGQWSVAVTLSPGTRTLRAIALDSAGNSSEPSNAVVVHVDAGIPTVQIRTANRSVHVDATSVTGTAADDRGVLTVEVRVLGPTGAVVVAQLADCATCGTGGKNVSWSVNPELEPGTYRVEVVATDAVSRSATRSIDIITL